MNSLRIALQNEEEINRLLSLKCPPEKLYLVPIGVPTASKVGTPKPVDTTFRSTKLILQDGSKRCDNAQISLKGPDM